MLLLVEMIDQDLCLLIAPSCLPIYCLSLCSSISCCSNSGSVCVHCIAIQSSCWSVAYWYVYQSSYCRALAWACCCIKLVELTVIRIGATPSKSAAGSVDTWLPAFLLWHAKCANFARCANFVCERVTATFCVQTLECIMWDVVPPRVKEAAGGASSVQVAPGRYRFSINIGMYVSYICRSHYYQILIFLFRVNCGKFRATRANSGIFCAIYISTWWGFAGNGWCFWWQTNWRLGSRCLKHADTRTKPDRSQFFVWKICT